MRAISPRMPSGGATAGFGSPSITTCRAGKLQAHRKIQLFRHPVVKFLAVAPGERSAVPRDVARFGKELYEVVDLQPAVFLFRLRLHRGVDLFGGRKAGLPIGFSRNRRSPA